MFHPHHRHIQWAQLRNESRKDWISGPGVCIGSEIGKDLLPFFPYMMTGNTLKEWDSLNHSSAVHHQR